MADHDHTRVLWVAKGLGPGGMERLLVHHARVGDRDRFDYSAAYVVERPNSIVPELEREGVPVHRLDARLGPVGWGRSLLRLVRSERIDVVHLHSPALAAVARPALRALRNGPLVVTTEHNSWDCYSWPTRLANAATYPLDHVRLAVSDDAIESVPRIFRGHAEVLVHGIDLERARMGPHSDAARREVRDELGIDLGAILVIVVANHRAEKGWDVLLDAASIVAARQPDVVFVGVGHGQLEEHHRREVTRLGLDGVVHLLGFRRDVGRLLAAADVFALGSRQEGLPVAVMEAMASGLPVVAPDVGGLALAVSAGRSGLLVAPEQPTDLADAITQVTGDPGFRSLLGAGAAAESEKFDVRRSVRRIEEIYSTRT